MTDDQLIDETAAAIAEELVTAGRDMQPRWSKSEIAMLAKRHLTAMLAKRSEAEKLSTNEERHEPTH